jgi:F0F1-type ATP synthase assembly protein I
LFHKGTQPVAGREQGEHSELYRGFGSSTSRAFELALSPMVLAAFGYLLDRLLGSLPVLTILFFVVGMVGLTATMWYGYSAKMKVHEQAGPWARRAKVEDR